MRTLDYALAYAARGLRVLAIEPGGKLPLTTHAVKDATTGPRIIREWWARWPTANVGIAAGYGLSTSWAVLDVDPRNGGDVELARREREHGRLPATITARTGGGGTHALYTFPAGVRLRGKVGPGLDLLGRGKYFLVAPSVTTGRYTWTSTKGTGIADAPHWLTDLARVREPEVPTAIAITRGRQSDVRTRVWAYLQATPPAIAGSGGHAATFVVAQKLVRGFGLDESSAYALMTEWNARCEPPWSKHDLARKINQAATAGEMTPGALRDAPRRTG